MNAKRALAAAVAVALVAGAFVVRGAIDDDPAASGPPSTEALPSAVAELVCITELANVCQALASADGALGVSVEPAGRTLERLAELDEPSAAPLWLTIEPFPAMADSLRGGLPPLAYETTATASSPLLLAVAFEGAATVLQGACPDAPLWSCLASHAGDQWSELGGQPSWGTVDPSLGDVGQEALPLASFAAAVAEIVGDPRPDPAAWQSDVVAIRGLARSSARAPVADPLATMVTRVSAVDVAATARFALDALGARGTRYELAYPAHDMWVQVVLAAPAGAVVPGGLAAELSERANAAGFESPEAALAPLPGAATMLELRQLWEEAT